MTLCQDGSRLEGYGAKLTTWNGQDQPEPYPFAYGFVNINFRINTFTYTTIIKPSEPGAPPEEKRLGQYRLYYTRMDGVKVEGALHLAWPLQIRYVTQICASGNSHNIQQHVVTPGQNGIWDIGKLYSPQVDITENLRQLNPQLEDKPFLFPGELVTLPVGF
jgi:hypothetical protein